MNVRDLTYRFEPVDWMLIGYLFGVFLWWVSETISSSTSTNNQSDVVGGWDQATLGEQAFQRLEQGEDISISRWHGGELVLRGDVVIDVEDVEEE